MKKHYQVVVIGGGIVGASVLYHIAKQGWTEIALIERKELTAGSTWHAAAGFHPLNNDLNVSNLQAYTINLYSKIQEESGQDVGIHVTGSIALAASASRWEYLKHTHAQYIPMGMETSLLTPAEIGDMCPIVKIDGLHGGLLDVNEGHLDPHGATVAYVKVAQQLGADVILRNQVLELTSRTDGGWDVLTEQGPVTAEHVVNAGGLWARRVGRMAGVNLPVVPMQHHYLVSEEMPILAQADSMLPAVVDLDGFTYLREERNGLLLGVYELEPKHWHVDGAPWDYGMDLIPEEIDRIAPQLNVGFERFPALNDVGIRRWVNGAFTFTPDGNPLVGPVRGLRNYWVACGVMAGFSQGGGVGLALAQWMVDGEPEVDVFGMDVARYGTFASGDRYVRDMTRQFYSRRFVMIYPNEELPAGRPLKHSPAHDALKADGAQFGCLWGLEVPLYFTPGQPDFVETPSLRRSNAFDYEAHEAKAVRNAVGMADISGFARYEISGEMAESWLDILIAGELPGIGGMRLAPMLTPAGRLMGDLIVMRLDEDRFWLVGSYYLQSWHMRWFEQNAPRHGATISNISDQWTGISICGPRSRELLGRLTGADVSNEGFRFMNCKKIEAGFCEPVVGRVSVTGELGYEINVPSAQHRALHHAVIEAGEDLGLQQFGSRAMNSLRLEKGYGAWSVEYSRAYTPKMARLDRFISFDKPDFIGKEQALAERDAMPKRLLTLLQIDSADADASGFEPVWSGRKCVGFITSGGYGHCVDMSLGLAYVDSDVVQRFGAVSVDVVGERRSARLLTEAPYDPEGVRMRQ